MRGTPTFVKAFWWILMVLAYKVHRRITFSTYKQTSLVVFCGGRVKTETISERRGSGSWSTKYEHPQTVMCPSNADTG